MTVVPEAWQNDTAMTEERKNFYRFAAYTMEPWDGPALVTFRFVHTGSSILIVRKYERPCI